MADVHAFNGQAFSMTFATLSRLGSNIMLLPCSQPANGFGEEFMKQYQTPARMCFANISSDQEQCGAGQAATENQCSASRRHLPPKHNAVV